MSDPTATLESTRRTLEAARLGSDPRALARALAAHANALVGAGEFAAALEASDESARVLEGLGDAREAARGWLLGAALARLAGQPAAAVTRVQTGLARLEPTDALRAPALATLGEALLGAGRAVDAAARFAEALEVGGQQSAAVRAGWTRQRAAALFTAGDTVSAVATWRAARGLYREAGDEAGAGRAMLEAAAAWQRSGHAQEAAGARWEARLAVDASGDLALRSDLELLEASAALEARRGDEALMHARAARSAALEGVAPSQYLAAAVTLSTLHEALRQPVDAYGALASAWVTVKDLLGQDAADTGLNEALLGLRDRLGVAAFDAARAQYEAQRRAARQSN